MFTLQHSFQQDLNAKNFFIYKMNPLQITLLAITSFLGYPIGRFIARHTKEELKSGKNWFLAIILVCTLGIIFFPFFIKGESLIFLISSLVFVVLIALSSLK